MNAKAILVSFVILSIIVSIISCSSQKAEWQGTIEEVDGVTVVKNPKEPMYGEEAFEVEEELVIGEADGREEYMFQSIGGVEVSDNGDIYVVDYKAQHIKVYNVDGEYLRTIGRPGQGPGELFGPRTISFTQQGDVVVGDRNNVTYFSEEGDYIKRHSLAKSSPLSISLDIDGNFLGFGIVRDKGVYELRKYDPELNYMFSYGSSPLPSVEMKQTGKRNVFFTLLRWDIINGNQIVCGYPEEGYIIKTYDSSGNLVRRIEKEYDKIEISKKEEEEAIAEYPEALREGAYAPKYHPPFRTLRADDEGRVCVYTNERTPDKEQYYYDVFDANGRYIQKIPFKTSFRIHKNKLYAVEEDEEGFQVVKRYKITWKY
jgi:hypothetical protein